LLLNRYSFPTFQTPSTFTPSSENARAANLTSQRKHPVLPLSKLMLSKTPEKNPHKFDGKKSPNPTWNDWFTFDFLGVLCIFFIYAGSSVPAINEPHYWTKAAHFWNPGFGKGDLFLESGDAHWLFFATFGCLTKYLPMVWAVWTGRFITWILLAFGWTLLGHSLWTCDANGRSHREKNASLVASAWALVWLAGLHWGHWAGEWVIGGCESKGVAYAFVFIGLAMAIRHRWLLAWCSLGTAAAFHVVVGVWVIACVVCISFLLDRVDREKILGQTGSGQTGWPAIRTWIALHRAGWIICAVGVLVGVVPAIRIDWGTDARLATESAVMQAYLRLGHHLVPTRFSSERWQGFGAQLIVAGMLAFIAFRSSWQSSVDGKVSPDMSGSQERDAKTAAPSSDRLEGNFFATVWAQWRELFASLPRGMQWIIGCGLFALAVSVIGLLVDLTLGRFDAKIAAKLLRFYWFRWNDVALPMMIGSLVISYAYGKLVFDPNPALLRVMAWFALLVPGVVLLGYRFDSNVREGIPAGDKAHFVAKTDSEMDQLNQYRDWLRVCDWIQGHTDENALWLTPRRQQSFKWRTGRAELACWKDAPQNAESLVQWGERLADAYQFGEKKILQPWTDEKLWDLHKKYGIRYVLLDRRVAKQSLPLLPLLYPSSNEFNDNFAVFEFPSMPETVSQ
jgi:hypothetical protein